MRVVVLIALSAIVLAGCGRPDPEQARKRMGLPPAGYVTDVGRGEAVYQQRCSSCHGAGLRGTHQGPPLLDRIYEGDHHADLAFYRAVKDGVRQHHFNFGDMPPQPDVTPEQAADIVAWVRQRQRQEGIR